MSRKKTLAAPASSRRTEPRDVGEGRGPTLDLKSAVAIAFANKAAGFDPPPAALAAMESADPAELDAAIAAVSAAAVIDTPNDQAEGGDPPAGSQTPQE